MEKITLKTKYVKIDGWRGRQEPINMVCGANDTGMWSDSPCKTTDCLAEIKMATDILRKNNIKYKTTMLGTSNVFCQARYVVVSENNVERAKELIRHLVKETRLLYID